MAPAYDQKEAERILLKELTADELVSVQIEVVEAVPDRTFRGRKLRRAEAGAAGVPGAKALKKTR